jgi:tetratricopeptide (TPR) repeat protein
MKFSKKYFLFICAFFLSGFFFAQQKASVESLKKALALAKNDSARILILQQLVNNTDNENWLSHNDSVLVIAETALRNTKLKPSQRNFFMDAVSFYNCNKGLDLINHDDITGAAAHYRKSLSIAWKTGNKTETATAYNGLGYVHQYTGNPDSALYFFEKSAALHEAAGNYNETAAPLANMASIYSSRGNIPKALEINLRTLKIYEKAGDKSGASYCLVNMGQLYQKDGNLVQAFDNFTRAYEIRKATKDEVGMGNVLQNLARIYQLRKEFDKAEKCLREGLALHIKVGNRKGISSSLYVLGVNFAQLQQYDSAYACQIKSLEIVLPLNEKQQLGRVYDGLVEALFKLNRINEAEGFALKQLKLSRELGYPEQIRNAAENLKDIYKVQGKYNNALEMFQLFIEMRDSIHNADTKKAAIRTQLQYEYDKKAAADSTKNAEAQKVTDAQLRAQTAKLKQEKFQRYSLVVGLLLVACGLVFAINRFRITRQQKKIIEAQKIKVDEAFEKLHEKNKEVMDSIYYARRIQRALITNEKYINKKLKELNS